MARNEGKIIFNQILSICMDIDLHTQSDQYKWQLGPCYSSHDHSGNARYSEKCCIPYGDHILSCGKSDENGWANSVVKIGSHQFCDDLVGLDKLIAINIPGEVLRLHTQINRMVQLQILFSTFFHIFVYHVH